MCEKISGDYLQISLSPIILTYDMIPLIEHIINMLIKTYNYVFGIKATEHKVMSCESYRLKTINIRKACS